MRARTHTGLDASALVVLTVVGAVVTWIRVPADHRDRVWAEDANIFLGEALAHGPWSVLFEGYAGYQHLVPRLVIAFLLPVLDLAAYPAVVFAICAVLTGLVAAAVYWLARDLVPWRPARLTLASITFLIPLATQETIGNLADLHTYAMWLTPWLLLYRPRTWWSSAAWAIVTFAVVMTEIQSVFFVFLIAFRLRGRDRKAWPVFGAFVLASVAQVLTAVAGERNTSNGVLSIPSTIYGWLINSVMPIVSADPDTIRRWVLDSGVTVGIVVLVPIVAAAIYVLVRGTGDQRLLTVSLALGSAAIYTGSAWANSGPWFQYAEVGLANILELAVNIRYGVASGMMLVAIVAVAAGVMVERRRSAFTVAIATVIYAASVTVLALGSATGVSSRDWVDRWSPAVEQAETTCSSGQAIGDRVTLPVAPDRSIELSCEDIESLER